MTVAVPDRLEEALSPQWLTAALRPRFPGITVSAVEPGSIIERISTVALFTIECADGVPHGLSPQLCIKGYFNEVGRANPSIGEAEAYFYRDLAAATGVRTLRSVYADIDSASRHGVVITEDLGTEGGVFLDAVSDYTPDNTAESLEQFARLHAATWGDPTYASLAWLRPRLAGIPLSRGVDVIGANLNGPNGSRVPVEVRQPQRLYEAYITLLDRWDQTKPWSVVHGDAHVGNLILEGAGRPGPGGLATGSPGTLEPRRWLSPRVDPHR